LSPSERRFAPTLYEALCKAEQAWKRGWTKGDCIREAVELIQSRVEEARKEPQWVDIRLDYVQMNDAETFEELDAAKKSEGGEGGQVILSGALWVGKTRLIDNILLEGR
jgi:pantoate--beta-alanine ligase